MWCRKKRYENSVSKDKKRDILKYALSCAISNGLRAKALKPVALKAPITGVTVLSFYPLLGYKVEVAQLLYLIQTSWMMMKRIVGIKKTSTYHRLCFLGSGLPFSPLAVVYGFLLSE